MLLSMALDVFSLLINMSILSHHPNPAELLLPRTPMGTCHLSDSILLYHCSWLVTYMTSIVAEMIGYVVSYALPISAAAGKEVPQSDDIDFLIHHWAP